MPLRIERQPIQNAAPLRLSTEKRVELQDWLVTQVEEMLSAQAPQRKLWAATLKAYNVVRKKTVREVPYEGAYNEVVPIVSTITDDVYNRLQELTFSVTPLITVRPVSAAFTAHAKDFQVWSNWCAANEFGPHAATEHGHLDFVQLGNVIYYCPHVEFLKKGRSLVEMAAHPVIYAIDPNDFLVPPGTYGDIQQMPLVAIRFWYNEGDMQLRKRLNKWRIGRADQAGGVDPIRTLRENLGRTHHDARGENGLYEIFEIYCYYDIDGDGVQEDLFVVFDHTTQTILHVDYNPYDRRPFEYGAFQPQSHLFHGLSPASMALAHQASLSKQLNHMLDNQYLANCRMFRGPLSMPGKIRVRPGGTVRLANPDQVSELRLADIYPSALATFQLEMTLVQSRTGVNDITSPQPSPALGTRTPGVTALAFVQAANRRFAAAFSSARLALGRAIIQCHIRQQERIRMGDAKLRQKINDVMGDPASAQRVIEILRSPTFDDMLSLELTVSSASINREVDQQNSILLANILSQYYERILQLMTVASSPETPEAVRETAKRIIRAAAEMVDRTIRTFDNTRDPRNFIVEVDDVLEADKRPTDGIETPAGELFAKLLGGAPQSNETIQ